MARDMQRYLRPGVTSTPFCPGCGHGILMGLILRAIDELKLNMDDMLFVSGICDRQYFTTGPFSH